MPPRWHFVRQRWRWRCLLQGYVKRFGISPAALPALTMHYLLRVLCMDCDLAREVAPATGAGQFVLPAAA